MIEPSLKGVSLSRIVNAYQRFQSVAKAAEELGLVGQSIHRFLLRHGIPVNKPPLFTETELLEIETYYKTAGNDFDLDALSKKMGRPKTSIARIARKLNLTDQSRMTARMLRAVQSNYSRSRWERHPHPRGFLGGKHTPEALLKISKASKLTWSTAKAFGIGYMSPEKRNNRSKIASARMLARPAKSVYTKGNGGTRPDLGIFVRSSWEANYARYLNLLKKMQVIEGWQYEPETFWFNGIRRGTLTYKPDFKIIYKSSREPEYVEIKGWETARDRTKWRRMKKYHPHIKLTVIRKKEYKNIKNRWASAIPEWERDGQ